MVIISENLELCCFKAIDPETRFVYYRRNLILFDKQLSKFALRVNLELFQSDLIEQWHNLQVYSWIFNPDEKQYTIFVIITYFMKQTVSNSCTFLSLLFFCFRSINTIPYK